MKTTFSQLPQFGSSKFKQAGLPLSGDSKPAPTSEGFANDSWETILEIIEYGNYKDLYNVGDTKVIELTDIGEITIEIAGFDKDELTDGSGYAAMTFITKDALTTAYMNNRNDDTYSWDNCTMRSRLKTEYLPTFPQIIQDNIKFVNKTYYSSDGDTLSVSDDIWLLSLREVNASTSYAKESTGCIYDELFPDDDSRIKTKDGTTVTWWVRTRNYVRHRFNYITINGGVNYDAMTQTKNIVFGFCI